MQIKEINEFLKLSYDSVDSDLKFAETKNTFLVTFNSALIGIIVAFLTGEHTISYSSRVILIAFTLLILLSTLLAILSFVPQNKIRKYLVAKDDSKNPKFMFYRYNASNFPIDNDSRYEDFKKAIEENCESNEKLTFYENELIVQIVDLSNVAYTKFKLFIYAVYIEIIASLLFAIFLILA